MQNHDIEHTFNGRFVSDKHRKKFPTCSKCGMSTCMNDYLRYLRSTLPNKENDNA